MVADSILQEARTEPYLNKYSIATNSYQQETPMESFEIWSVLNN